MAVKCKINASHKRLPVAGTEADGKGQCPECLTPDRKLTGKGFIGAHNVVLDVDTAIPVTDEGLRVGAPRDAAVKREIEARQMRAGTRDVPQGGVADPVMTTGHGRGPTLVRGRETTPAVREEADASWAQIPADTQVPWEIDPERREGGTRTVLDQPLGRERFDRKITTVPEPKKRRTAAERRRYRRSQQRASK